MDRSPPSCFWSEDASDDANTLRTERSYKAGEGLFYRFNTSSVNRWGDYSATVVDPANDVDLWTIQEYAAEPVSPGTTSGNGRWGTWWAKVAPPSGTNDAFANASQISGGQGSTTGYLYRSTKEANEPAHAGNSAYITSIWYKWTAPSSANVSFYTGSPTNETDTLLAVYTGASLASLTPVASNDNAAANTKFSKLSFNAGAGTNYYIAVAARTKVIDGHDSITLDWTQPSAPFFVSNPQPLESNLVASNAFVLTSLAIGVPTPSYQWRKDSNFNSTFSDISGATNANYTNGNLQLSDQGAYYVVASNSGGSATSSIAKLWTYASGSATLSGTTVTNLTNILIHISGVTTHAYVVQTSTNLVNWTAINTNNASFNFVTNMDTLKFYRAVFY